MATLSSQNPFIKCTLHLGQFGYCNGCKARFDFADMTLDHIVPRSKGGSDEFRNLQLLCRRCNGIKGDRDMAYLTAYLEEDRCQRELRKAIAEAFVSNPSIRNW